MPAAEPSESLSAPVTPDGPDARSSAVKSWSGLMTGMVMALVVLVYASLKVLQHRAFDTRLYDTGIYQDLVVRLARGEGGPAGWSEVLGRGHFGEHFNPIVWVLALIYRMASMTLGMPGPTWLLVIQGLAVGMTAWGLWSWRRAVARERASTLPTSSESVAADRVLSAVWWVALAAYAPLHAAWAGEFSPIVLGMPMVAFGLAAAHARRWRWVWVWSVLLLTTRESAPLSVLGLAIYAGAVVGVWRQALALAIFAGVSAAVILGWVMPGFREMSAGLDGQAVRWHQAERLGPLNDWAGKSRYLVWLLLPLAGLPLFGRRAIAALGAAVPGLLLNLATDTGNQYAVAYHYDAQLGVFVVAASGLGLDRARHVLHGLPVRGRRFARYALVGVWGLWIFALAAHTPIQQWRAWQPDESDRALHAALQQVVTQAAPNTRWAADDVAGPHVVGIEPRKGLFVPIKVDTRETGSGIYPYVPRLAGGHPLEAEAPTLILLARRSWDFVEHRAILEATGRVEVLQGDEPDAVLLVMRWRPED